MSLTSLTRRWRGRGASGGGGGGGGDYAYLTQTVSAPPNDYNGNPCVWNTTTGRWEGLTVDCKEPTWAVTDSTLTDTGNASTNLVNLQAKVDAIAASATGHTCILVPVAQYQGDLELTTPSHNYRIGLKSAQYASLPAQGTTDTIYGTVSSRVNPTDHAAYMPEFYAAGGSSGLVINTGSLSKNYFVRGLRFTNRNSLTGKSCFVSAYVYNSTLNTEPTNIVFAQCLVDGNDGYLRAAILGGTSIAWVDSYTTKIYNGSDCQDVLFVNGVGKYLYANNFSLIGGAKENVMVGGTVVEYTYVPQDIMIVGNDMRGAASGSHKATIEIKWGGRILIAHNYFGYHNGLSPQEAHVITKLTPQTSDTASYPYVKTFDLIIHSNIATEGPGFAKLGGSNEYVTLYYPRRVECVNNLMYGINSGSGRSFVTAPEQDDVRIVWNTSISNYGSGHGLYVTGDGFPDKIHNFEFRYNVVGMPDGHGGRPIAGDAGSGGNTAITNNMDGTVLYAPNLMNNSADALLVGQLLPGDLLADLQLDTDYSLLPTSLGYQAGPDGQDFGAAIAICQRSLTEAQSS